MQEFTYDAFISYRHIPHDKAVAVKLQKLLEHYIPPKHGTYTNTKRIKKIFRDESELPTSGDLDADIKKALRESAYLIVVCSEETKHSQWCLKEIEYFKELHHGHNENILTLLVSGDPSAVFPDALFYETKEEITPEGEVQTKAVLVEPLAANVTAESTVQSLKKLKTEFLRIAAPILGCGYDDLYRRQQKRLIKNIITAAAAVVMIVTSFGVYAFTNAQIIKKSEQVAVNRLADIYTSNGFTAIKNNDFNAGLAFLANALKMNPDKESAINAVNSLLRYSAWPILYKSVPGILLDDCIVVNRKDAEDLDGIQNLFIVNDHVSLSNVIYLSQDKTKYATYYTVYNADGSVHSKIIQDDIDAILDQTEYFGTVGRDTLAYQGPDDSNQFVLYHVNDSTLSSITLNQEINPTAQQDYLYFSLKLYDDGEKAVSTYANYATFYTKEGDNFVQESVIDLSEAWTDDLYFPNGTNNIYLGTDICVITEGSRLTMIRLRDQKVVGTAILDPYYISDVDIFDDGSKIAVGCGQSNTTTSGFNFANAGYAAVYDNSGNLLSSTKDIANFHVKRVRFDSTGNQLMFGGSDSSVHTISLKEGIDSQYYKSIPTSFLNEEFLPTNGFGFCAVQSISDNMVHFYDLTQPQEKKQVVSIKDKGYSIIKTFPLSNDELMISTTSGVYLVDKDSHLIKKEVDFSNYNLPRTIHYISDIYKYGSSYVVLRYYDPDGTGADTVFDLARINEQGDLLTYKKMGETNVYNIKMLEDRILLDTDSSTLILDYDFNELLSMDRINMKKVVFVGNSRMIAASSTTLSLYDLNTGAVLDTFRIALFPEDFASSASDISISQDADKICIAANNEKTHSGELWYVDFDEEQNQFGDFEMEVIPQNLKRFYENFDGHKTILATLIDGTILILDPETLRLENTIVIETTGELSELVMDKNQRFLAVSQKTYSDTAFPSYLLDVYDLQMQDIISLASVKASDGVWLKGLQFTSDNILYYGRDHVLNQTVFAVTPYEEDILDGLVNISRRQIDESYKAIPLSNQSLDETVLHKIQSTFHTGFMDNPDHTESTVLSFAEKLEGLETELYNKGISKEMQQKYLDLERELDGENLTVTNLCTFYPSYIDHFHTEFSSAEYRDVTTRWLSQIQSICDSQDINYMLSLDRTYLFGLVTQLMDKVLVNTTDCDDIIHPFVEDFEMYLVNYQNYEILVVECAGSMNVFYTLFFTEEAEGMEEILLQLCALNSEFSQPDCLFRLMQEDIDGAAEAYQIYYEFVRERHFEKSPELVDYLMNHLKSWVRVFAERDIIDPNTAELFLTRVSTP